MTIEVPLNPRDIGINHDKWHREQYLAIQKIVNCDKDFIFLQAPTGSGKSAIAVATLKLLGVRGMVVVKTKSLQEQYLKESDGIVLIKGRGNYRCMVVPQVSCADAPCTIVGKASDCPQYDRCPYYTEKAKALRAQIVVTNYPYFMLSANATNDFTGLDYLILDEGDIAEKEVINYVATNLKNTATQEFLGCNVPHLGTSESWREWAHQQLPKLTTERGRLTHLIEDDPMNAEMLVKSGKMNRFIDDVQSISKVNDSWVITPGPFGTFFSPIWCNEYTEHSLFRHATKTMLMSATMPAPPVFAWMMGIGVDDFFYKEMPHTFAKERRLVYYIPSARLTFKTMGTELPKLVDAIDRVIEIEGGQKGVIHTHTNSIRDYILTKSAYRHIMMTTSGSSREEAIQKFIDAPAPKVLVSPSVGRGESFDYDVARWQIIAKLPFPDRSDGVVEKRLETDPTGRWYGFETACQIVQMAGRVCRAPDDRGVTYILDSNYGWFENQNMDLFPSWYTEAVIRM